MLRRRVFEVIIVLDDAGNGKPAVHKEVLDGEFDTIAEVREFYGQWFSPDEMLVTRTH